MTLWTVTHQAPLSMGFSRQDFSSVQSLSHSGCLINNCDDDNNNNNSYFFITFMAPLHILGAVVRC